MSSDESDEHLFDELMDDSESEQSEDDDIVEGDFVIVEVSLGVDVVIVCWMRNNPPPREGVIMTGPAASH